jgi:hypothetical protein
MKAAKPTDSALARLRERCAWTAKTAALQVLLDEDDVQCAGECEQARRRKKRVAPSPEQSRNS